MILTWYTSLRDHLRTTVPDLATVDIWKHQLEDVDWADPEACAAHANLLPATYVEFERFAPARRPNGDHVGDATLQIHLAQDLVTRTAVAAARRPSRWERPAQPTADQVQDPMQRVDAILQAVTAAVLTWQQGREVIENPEAITAYGILLDAVEFDATWPGVFVTRISFKLQLRWPAPARKRLKAGIATSLSFDQPANIVASPTP